MIFAVAVHGTRGDIEPCAALGLELLRRGHDVRLAVPPNLVDFVAGLIPAVPYGVDSQKQLDADIFRKYWKIQNPVTALREVREYITQGWAEMSTTLTSLAGDADLILTGTTYQEVAANVAEYYGIPLAALHYFPARANSQVLPVPLPAPLVRTAWSAVEWVHWRALKQAEDAQRDDLGLPKATVRAVRRIVEGGALEIQAYDELFFPRLAAEWGNTRPLVGSMTLELGADTDDEVASWIAAGSPPIYFGFGSIRAPDGLSRAMIESARALGRRAIVFRGWADLALLDNEPDCLTTDEVNQQVLFKRVAAVVHHGGAGTTTAAARAGAPQVVIPQHYDQFYWAERVERLGIGAAHTPSVPTSESLPRALDRTLVRSVSASARSFAGTMRGDGARVAAQALRECVAR